MLEDRTSPAIVSWDGGGSDFRWENPLNWSADALPGSADDVVIGSAFVGVTITSTSNVTISSVSSEASLVISAGSTFTIASASTLNASLSLSGGILTGTGDLTVTGALGWGGGSSIAGSGTLTANGSVIIDGSTNYLIGRTFINNGAVAFDSTHLHLSGGGSVVNNGSFDFRGAGNTIDMLVLTTDGSGSFTNNSMLSKTGTRNAELRLPVQSVGVGSVTVFSGLLALTRGGTHTGSFTGVAGTTLQFGGDHEFEPGASISGDRVFFHDGQAEVDAPYSAGRTEVLGEERTAQVRFTGVTNVGTELLVHRRGSNAQVGQAVADLTALAGPLSFGTLTLQGGRLLAAGDVTVTGQFTTASAGTAHSEVSGGGTLFLEGNAAVGAQVNDRLALGLDLVNRGQASIIGFVDGAAGVGITNDGTIYLDDGAELFLHGGGAFVNNDSLDFRGAGRASGTGHSKDMLVYTDGTVSFTNNDTLTKTGARNAELRLPVQSVGSVSVSSGLLALTRGGTHTGSFTGVAGTTLQFGDTTTLQPTSQVLSDGMVVFDGGMVNLQFEGAGSGARFPQISAQSVALSSVLTLTAANSFAPHLNDPFTIVNNTGEAAINGTFNNLPEGTIFWAGSYAFQISYVDGDGNDVVLTTKQIATAVAISWSDSSYSGFTHPATGSVTAANGVNLGSPTFTYYAGTTATGMPLSGPPVNAGTYTVLAAFAGNTSYTASSATQTITIAKATPSLAAALPAPVVLGTGTVTLSGNVTTTPVPVGQTVSVLLNGVLTPATIQANGSFSVSVSTNALAVGRYTVTYNYAGDANFNAASVSTTLDITYNIRVISNPAKKAGSSIPIEIQLTDAAGVNRSADVSSVTAVGFAPVGNPTLITPVTGSTAFQALPNFNRRTSWKYNLQTPTTLAPGDYLFYFTVPGDPYNHSVIFTIKP